MKLGAQDCVRTLSRKGFNGGRGDLLRLLDPFAFGDCDDRLWFGKVIGSCGAIGGIGKAVLTNGGGASVKGRGSDLLTPDRSGGGMGLASAAFR